MFGINLPALPGLNLGDGIFFTVIEYALYAVFLVFYFLTAPLLAMGG